MNTRSFRRTGLVAAAALPLVVAGVTVTASSAGAAAKSRHTLAGTSPSWAKAGNRVGTPKASATFSGRTWLRFNNAAQAAALAKAVTDRKSPSYGHYLTAKQFNAKFSPTASQVSSVKSWLRGAGLTVTGVGAHNRWVGFRGTVANAKKAFGVSFGRYKVRGGVYRAPTANASVPSSLGSTVLSVSGLDSMPHVAKPMRSTPFPPPAGFRNARPCSAYWNQKSAAFQADGTTPLPQFNGRTLHYAPCGWTPPQFRAVYGLNPAVADGSGVTVAIVDAYAAPTIVEDANQYAANHDPGAPALVEGQNFFQTNASNFVRGTLCTGNGWYGEETLDVEAVHGMAPGATIHYYGGASCLTPDLYDAVQNAIDDNVDAITNSYGDIELTTPVADMLAADQQYQQAAAQGITVSFSSGDDGDESVNLGGIKSADVDGNDPWVTSVGGTSLGISASNTVAFETGWGTHKWSLSSDGTTWNDLGFLYGAGGGASNFFDQPDYQKGVAAKVNARIQPDISFDGDPNTGMLIGETQRFGTNAKSDAYDEFRIGGTSLSSPLFAGVIAVADQLAAESGHANIGFANPSIYDLYRAGSPTLRDVIHHGGGVVRADFANSIDASGGILYSVRTFDQDTSLRTRVGYDEVTGVGSPGAGFAAALAAAAPEA